MPCPLSNKKRRSCVHLSSLGFWSESSCRPSKVDCHVRGIEGQLVPGLDLAEKYFKANIFETCVATGKWHYLIQVDQLTVTDCQVPLEKWFDFATICQWRPVGLFWPQLDLPPGSERNSRAMDQGVLRLLGRWKCLLQLRCGHVEGSQWSQDDPITSQKCVEMLYLSWSTAKRMLGGWLVFLRHE